MSSSVAVASTATPKALPVRIIPGGYGWPLLGQFSDRLDYFWFQGQETFYRKRMEKYNSTVFRTNVPPSFPFLGIVNPNMIAVLDCKSFAHMFDMEIVEKKNVLIGDYMPSLKFTGDTRVCAYLDPSEPQHAKVKSFALDILKRSSNIWLTELLNSLDSFWDTVEQSVAKEGKASYMIPLKKCIFNFITKALTRADPASSPGISESGYFMFDKWMAVQLLPTKKVGLLQPLEEIFLHSFTYPFALVKGDYKKLYEFIEKEGKEVVGRGVNEFGLSREDTIHNLLFIVGVNAYAGFSAFLPYLIKTIGGDTTGLQEKLRKEVRERGGSTLTFDSVNDMKLIQSVVYETLRLNPPVDTQFARARKDFQLSSHDSVYEVKKGELLCGYQKLVMRDPKVFDNPESFVPDRFTSKGRELLSYLYWSNGPQTESPNASNKQCAGKDIVTPTAFLFVAHLFRRYDSFTFDSSSGTITSFKRATSA